MVAWGPGKVAPEKRPGHEGARLELVFDRSTYRFLGDHYLDLTPHPEGGDPTDEPDSGAGEERTTVLKVGVADRPPDRG